MKHLLGALAALLILAGTALTESNGNLFGEPLFEDADGDGALDGAEQTGSTGEIQSPAGGGSGP